MAELAVVDDNAGARRFMAAALEKGGHAVTEIEPKCLFKVLEALHREVPALLISDLIMPNCPGKSVIRACREDPHLKQLRILLLTGHGDIQLAHFLQGMGNVHYLAKPVSPAGLLECVDYLLSPQAETDPGWALGHRGVVTVVDDSRLSRAFHSACLLKEGFRPVQIAPTELLETVQAIEAADPQLLMVDYLMPRFNGDTLIRAIRARAGLNQVPILLITAHHGDDIEALVRAHAGVEILHKPTTQEDLMASVRSALA